jgi:hypothetical protein
MTGNRALPALLVVVRRFGDFDSEVMVDRPGDVEVPVRFPPPPE